MREMGGEGEGGGVLRVKEGGRGDRVRGLESLNCLHREGKVTSPKN